MIRIDKSTVKKRLTERIQNHVEVTPDVFSILCMPENMLRNGNERRRFLLLRTKKNEQVSRSLFLSDFITI